MVLEKTLEGPLDCKEIQPVHSNRDQPWDFFGKTDAEAEALVLCPPHVKSDSLEKTLMLEKIEGRRRRGTEDEVVGWHHRLDGHEFGWSPGAGDGQGGLMCCGS